MDIKLLNNFHEQGLVYKQYHWKLPLIIWNYSEKTQFDDLWNPITLRTRALVTDLEGNEVNNPIPKFFNYTETRGKYAGDYKKSMKIYTKYDGSYIQIFRYNGEVIITSRGSFASDQVKMVDEIDFDFNLIEEGKTYCFELIHPDNRIVVDYQGKKELVLLAVRNLSGSEDNLEDYTDKFSIAKLYPFEIRKFKDIKKLADLNIKNEEGFVVLFENGERCKVKFEEYLILHRLLSNITTISIWSLLKEGKDLDNIYLSKIPDEFYVKIHAYKKKLWLDYNSLHSRACSLMENLHESGNGDYPERKQFAEWVKKQENIIQPILFTLYDNKNTNDLIWKLIKPKNETL